MPRGGFRPGAGRPRKDGTKPGAEKNTPAAVKSAGSAATVTAPAPVVVVTAFDTQDPAYLLSLVSQGETTLPSGVPITAGMISAAKELLPYYKAKLSTTTKLTDNRGPPEEVPTEELLRERTELLRALRALDDEIAVLEAGETVRFEAPDPREQRVDAAPSGKDELLNLLRGSP